MSLKKKLVITLLALIALAILVVEVGALTYSQGLKRKADYDIQVLEPARVAVLNMRINFADEVRAVDEYLAGDVSLEQADQLIDTYETTIREDFLLLKDSEVFEVSEIQELEQLTMQSDRLREDLFSLYALGSEADQATIESLDQEFDTVVTEAASILDQLAAEASQERVQFDRSIVRAINTGALVIFIVSSFAGVVFFVTFSRATRKLVLKPLGILSEAAESLGNGNLDARAKVQTKDEFNDLAKTFNRMASNLQNKQEELEAAVKARTEELQTLNQDLEQKVADRTKELKQKVSELERANAVMVGREMTMIEMKKQLKDKEKNNDKPQNPPV